MLDLKIFQKGIKISMNFCKKGLEKPTGLRLKGVSNGNSQVSTPFYSTKAESSSPHGNVAIDDEEDSLYLLLHQTLILLLLKILLFAKIN